MYRDLNLFLICLIFIFLESPRRDTEELNAGFEEKDEDPGDEFGLERELPVEVTGWRPLTDLLFQTNLSLDEAVRVAGLQDETLHSVLL